MLSKAEQEKHRTGIQKMLLAQAQRGRDVCERRLAELEENLKTLRLQVVANGSNVRLRGAASRRQQLHDEIERKADLQWLLKLYQERIAAASRQRRKRSRDERLDAAAAILRKQRALKPMEIMRKLDSKREQYRTAQKYQPRKSWGQRTWVDAYRSKSGAVRRFIHDVRKHIAES